MGLARACREPGATRRSHSWPALALIALLVVAGCGGFGAFGGADASYDGTYIGSFSGTPDPDDLRRKGVVEFRIVRGEVTGVFLTGLGRAIGFGATDGVAGRSLRVSAQRESGCTQVSGTFSEIAEPGAPPRAAFTGRLFCPEFTAEWQATRVGPPTAAAAPAPPRFSFSVPATLGDATVGQAYRHSFCDPEPASSLLCGGVVAVDLKNPIGGSQPFTFQKEVGDSLPWGLRLGSNGVLEGTPHAAALQGAPAGRTYGFRVCAVDSTRSYVCRATLLTVLPAAAASPTPTPTPTRTPTPTPTPTRTSPVPPTTAAPASRSYTGSVSISITYARTDSDFGTHQVQAMADLPFDVDFARSSQSTRRTETFSASYSVNPKPICGGSASSGSYSGASVSYYISGRVDAARDQVTFSVLITGTRSSPDLGVCWTKPELLLFTSGALDSSGNSFSFTLAGGELTKSGVLTFHESASKKTSYKLVAKLTRLP